MLLVAPRTGWLCRSTPTTLNELAPALSGTTTRQVVTLDHVRGQDAPLNQSVFTASGAVPVMIAVSALRVVELMANGMLATPRLFKAARMELCMVPIQDFRPPDTPGSCTVRPLNEVDVSPLATNAAYLASSTGLTTALFIATLAVSC